MENEEEANTTFDKIVELQSLIKKESALNALCKFN